MDNDIIAIQKMHNWIDICQYSPISNEDVFNRAKTRTSANSLISKIDKAEFCNQQKHEQLETITT